MRANFKCSLRCEEVKKADRICKESRARRFDSDAHKQVRRFYSKASVFKDLINSGPYFICAACSKIF